VQKAWVTEGEEGGRLGYPTGDSRKGTGDLSYAFFQGGQLTVSPGDQIRPFSYQVALN
jgi:uncharacterized protein with LGFP repeats